MIIAKPNQTWTHSQWSPPVVGYFRELWESNYPVREIGRLLAARFGVTLGKNSIIGKAHRMGLPRHGRAANRSTNPLDIAERATRRREYQRLWRAMKSGSVPPDFESAAPTVEDFAIPTPQRKTLYQLGDHDCRWPVGDPRSDLFFFCGAPASDDQPYCASHCRRAYEPRRQ